MLHIYLSQADGTLEELQEVTSGCWVSLVNPDEQEIQQVLSQLNIEPDSIRDALDEEEIPRVEREDQYVWIIVDIPVVISEVNNSTLYNTFPLAIIVTADYFVTVTLKENPIINDFVEKKVKDFYTFMKTRFVLQLLYSTDSYYLKYLKRINKRTNEIEEALHQSMRNQELYSLLGLSKSLVYFTTSLKANELVMEKMLRFKYLKMYAEDEDLLEDVIIENKQAIEMAHIYSNILSGMMDAFASVISNNLNIVMKFLTSVTIILTIPTMIASFYGMNVELPMQEAPYAFRLIISMSIFLSTLIGFIFAKKRYL